MSTEKSAGDDPQRRFAPDPGSLREFGEIFTPIEPRSKGTTTPRTEENLYAWDDQMLQAHIEIGWNYAVVSAGENITIDIDDRDAIGELAEELPDTATQVSGSRSSDHIFLRCPGLDEDIKLFDPDSGDHAGDIKAAGQSYVVGPGSVHPSGNQYGPIEGDEIATIEEEELREIIEPYLKKNAKDQDEGRDLHPAYEHGAGVKQSYESDDHRISVHDVLPAGSFPAGARTEHPYHGSDTGSNFMVDGNGETWRCWRHDCTGNALHLIGMEQGVISCGEWDDGGLPTSTWADVFEAAREAGYDIPDRERPENAWEDMHHVVLPDSPALKSAARSWNWRKAASADPALTLEQVRGRTQEEIREAMDGQENALVYSPMAGGKTYGWLKESRNSNDDQGVKGSYFAGRIKLLKEVRDDCEGLGLSTYMLPSIARHCPTFKGKHDAESRDRVRDLYARGVTPGVIHERLNLPCHEEGDPCPYCARWDFDPDDYDVLLGHYQHAYLDNDVTSGRDVCFDEHPQGSLWTQFQGDELQQVVNAFCEEAEDFPFENYTEIIENRRHPEKRNDAREWFEMNPIEVDESRPFSNDRYHTHAPHVVYTLLFADYGLDAQHHATPIPAEDRQRGVFFEGNSHQSAQVTLQTPPGLHYARSIICLDGTPSKKAWENEIGKPLTVRRVLSDQEYREFVRDTLGVRGVKTSEYAKPYSSGEYVNVENDRALGEAASKEYADGDPVVCFTTKKAMSKYEAEGLHAADGGPFKEIVNFADMKGENRWESEDVIVITGSPHYGDNWIKTHAAMSGDVIHPEGKGMERDYGAGQEYADMMRAGEVAQAALRAGRQGNGATVVIDTAHIPGWFPTEEAGGVVKTYTDHQREVLRALTELGPYGGVTTRDVHQHHAVNCSHRWVLKILEQFRKYGYVDGEIDGNNKVWFGDAIHKVNRHGEVELPPLHDLVDPDDADMDELSRMITYTPLFGPTSSVRGVDAEEQPDAAVYTIKDGGDTVLREGWPG